MDIHDNNPAKGNDSAPTYYWKQAIVLRSDLGMGKGKFVAQGSHASLEAYLLASESVQDAWRRDGMMKVALKVESQVQLMDVWVHAYAAGLPCAIIADAGRTQIPAGSLTAVGIGPAEPDRIDAVVGELKLL